MKFTSIKYKITLWYTSIIIIVFGIVLGASFFYTEYYGENEIFHLMKFLFNLRGAL